jgi:hypothetical protein
MTQNILKTFILTVFCISIVSAAVTLEYNDEGVLRKDGNCDITFTNFGTEKSITNLSVKKNIDNVNGTFNVTIGDLINGNIGLNNDSVFNEEDFPTYVKVTQDGEELTNFEFPWFNGDLTKFRLTINNLTTCDGLKIKLTFKDETVSVANRLYYVNKIPDSINHAFDSNLFGPSYNYPFKRIHWKINEGLEDLIKSCGIYLVYGNPTSSKGINVHWQYYLSVDSINSKHCVTKGFHEVIKRNYVDYHYTSELFGENYVGYVFKREGHVEAHMDGVIADNGYLIEVFHKKCNENSEQRTTCTIKSDEPLLFEEFTHQLIHDCFSDIIDENEEITWTIKSGNIIGQMKNKKITISKGDGGVNYIPSTIDDPINYKTSLTEDSTPFARFIFNFTCGDGTFMNDSCECQACASHCGKCTDAITCEKCSDENASFINDDSICIKKKGFFEDPVDLSLKPCKAECATCNGLYGCTTCKDPKAIISDGACICPHSYMKIDGTCFECEEGCSHCDKDNKCLACTDPTKIPDENGKCN